MIEPFIILIGLIVSISLVLSLNRPPSAIKHLIALLAYLQLCLGPFLYYKFFQGTPISEVWQLEMAVNFELYFSYILPAIIAFIVGLNLTRMKVYEGFVFDANSPKAIKILIWCGIVCQAFLFSSVHNSLWFLLNLGSSLANCGLLAIHMKQIQKAEKMKDALTLPALILFCLLFAQSAKSGMFEGLVFWGFILLTLTLSVLPRSLTRNFGILISGVLILVTVQTSKGIYRSKVWQKGHESNVTQLSKSLVLGFRVARENSSSETFWFPIVERLNQGRIVSHVIQKIEQNKIEQDFMRIPQALASACVPRLLWPDKPLAGGHENIKRFTDLQLQGNTSMNISHFGDFFIAFGKQGGPLFLLFWGFFLGQLIQRITSGNMTKYVLWLSPILLLGLIPIETDFNMVVNHIVKSALFIVFISKVLTRNQRANS